MDIRIRLYCKYTHLRYRTVVSKRAAETRDQSMFSRAMKNQTFSFSTNQIITVRLDCDNRTVNYYKADSEKNVKKTKFIILC